MIHHGDLFDVLPTLPECSVDACVTDPPYELAFMGKHWDGTGVAFQPETWGAVSRVMKPGSYVLAFGGTRTFHRLTCAIEDAGFEIRDCLSWLYGSGFPKSLNLGDGRGTALKPAWEPIILARKPLRGTVAANVEQFGTGALNIDVCRIEGESTLRMQRGTTHAWEGGAFSGQRINGSEIGRWPANVALDETAAAMLDAQSGELVSGANPTRRASDKFRDVYSGFQGQTECTPSRGLDIGGASRFFYVAKPSRDERDTGIYDLPVKKCGLMEDDAYEWKGTPEHGPHNTRRRNHHPTVKPVELMRWLVRLVTPLGGTVLDPFMGSGTTGMACALEARAFIGIEREAEYVAIAERRIGACLPLFADSLLR